MRPFEGLSFCITGPLEEYTRENYIAWIEERGGTYTSSVGKKTTYLVTNLPDRATVKMKKAIANGTKILSEKDLVKLLNLKILINLMKK